MTARSHNPLIEQPVGMRSEILRASSRLRHLPICCYLHLKVKCYDYHLMINLYIYFKYFKGNFPNKFNKKTQDSVLPMSFVSPSSLPSNLSSSKLWQQTPERPENLSAYNRKPLFWEIGSWTRVQSRNVFAKTAGMQEMHAYIICPGVSADKRTVSSYVWLCVSDSH